MSGNFVRSICFVYLGATVATVTVAIALGSVSFSFGLGPPLVVRPGSPLEAIGVTIFVYQFWVPHGATAVIGPASPAV